MKNRLFANYFENPKHLFRQLVAIAAIGLLAILLLAGFGIHRVYSHQMIANAKSDAVRISKALLTLEKEHLIDPVLGEIRLHPEELEHLDHNLRKFLHPFNILKIKIFDNSYRIVYSTDTAIIGRVDRNNARLARALAGFEDSKLEKKEEVLDLENETKFQVDVVETYVPVRDSRGEVIGSFEIYLDVSHYRTEIFAAVCNAILILGVILLAVFGGWLAISKIGADQLQITQERLRRMACLDPLTGLLNRRELFRRVNDEIDLFDRRSETADKNSLGVIMLDIDHFKSINDNHGHLAGDHVLREVACRIEGAIRQYDFVGRYGGEEFLVISPCASFADTLALAERLRRVIRDVPFSFAGNCWQITASLGIAVTAEGPQRFGLALELADEGLYLAKDGGRDRVAWVDPDQRRRSKDKQA